MCIVKCPVAGEVLISARKTHIDSQPHKNGQEVDGGELAFIPRKYTARDERGAFANR